MTPRALYVERRSRPREWCGEFPGAPKNFSGPNRTERFFPIGLGISPHVTTLCGKTYVYWTNESSPTYHNGASVRAKEDLRACKRLSIVACHCQRLPSRRCTFSHGRVSCNNICALGAIMPLFLYVLRLVTSPIS